MKRPAVGPAHTLAVALVGAGTTVATALAWSGLTERSEEFVGQLVALGLLLTATGTLMRVARLPGAVVTVGQLVLTTGFCTHHLGGSWVPTPTSVAAMVDAFAAAADAAQRFSAPVPSEAGLDGVQPVLLVGGAGCLFLVDLLVGTLRRAALAGLPLLGIYSVPVSILAHVDWWVFALGAGGFCLLLVLEQAESTAQWGRVFGSDRAALAAAPVHGGRAAVVAGAAIGLSLSVPVLVPTTEIGLLPGFGSGDGGDLSLENPMVDLRRDLLRGEDVPLVRIRTREPAPGYLRTAVLHRFTGNAWSSGDRDIPADQVARGEMPPLQGVRQQVPRQEYTWGIDIADEFDSRWLPTPSPISRINASGDWKYDRDTMDFVAADDDLTAAGMTYSSNAVRLDLDATELADVPSGSGAVADEFTELPDELPSLVGELADQVTRGRESDFEKARALQSWFRTDGGFSYSLETDTGSGTDDLVDFLSDEPGGRVGYCEQFSAAMAVMARALDIPSRVAVGFLTPERISETQYVYSSHDLHAWTEVYITGAGWVRFEPTPQARAPEAPGYTTEQLPQQQDPDASVPAPGQARPTDGPGNAQQLPEDGATSATDEADEDEGGLSAGMLTVTGIVVVLVLLLLVPRTVRVRRRRRRLAPGVGVEAAWSELRDSAVDLGHPWPAGQSPRVVGEQVRGWMHTGEGPVLSRSRHQAEQVADATAALERLVLGVELERFGPEGATGPGTIADTAGEDARRCVDQLRDVSGQDRVLRADWWPASVFRRDLGSTYDAELSLDHISR